MDHAVGVRCSLLAGLVLILVVEGLGKPSALYPNHANRWRSLTMSPKPCFGPEGTKGTCTFKWDCISQNGISLSTCRNDYLFGACCKLPEKPSTSPPSEEGNKGSEGFKSTTSIAVPIAKETFPSETAAHPSVTENAVQVSFPTFAASILLDLLKQSENGGSIPGSEHSAPTTLSGINSSFPKSDDLNTRSGDDGDSGQYFSSTLVTSIHHSHDSTYPKDPFAHNSSSTPRMPPSLPYQVSQLPVTSSEHKTIVIKHSDPVDSYLPNSTIDMTWTTAPLNYSISSANETILTNKGTEILNYHNSTFEDDTLGTTEKTVKYPFSSSDPSPQDIFTTSGSLNYTENNLLLSTILSGAFRPPSQQHQSKPVEWTSVRQNQTTESLPLFTETLVTPEADKTGPDVSSISIPGFLFTGNGSATTLPLSSIIFYEITKKSPSNYLSGSTSDADKPPLFSTSKKDDKDLTSGTSSESKTTLSLYPNNASNVSINEQGLFGISSEDHFLNNHTVMMSHDKNHSTPLYHTTIEFASSPSTQSPISNTFWNTAMEQSGMTSRIVAQSTDEPSTTEDGTLLLQYNDEHDTKNSEITLMTHFSVNEESPLSANDKYTDSLSKEKFTNTQSPSETFLGSTIPIGSSNTKTPPTLTSMLYNTKLPPSQQTTASEDIQTGYFAGETLGKITDHSKTTSMSYLPERTETNIMEDNNEFAYTSHDQNNFQTSVTIPTLPAGTSNPSATLSFIFTNTSEDGHEVVTPSIGLTVSVSHENAIIPKTENLSDVSTLATQATVVQTNGTTEAITQSPSLPSTSWSTSPPRSPTKPSSKNHTTEILLDYRKHCGVRPLRPSGRIVGGRNTFFGKWPWQALVKEATWLGLFIKNKCGGVLINAKYVLTAAHCQPGFLSSLIVVLGAHDLSGGNETLPPITKNVKRMIVHRKYKAQTFENDLALLEMESSVDFQPHIVPICLPRRHADFTGKTGYVSGWGKLFQDGSVPNVLQEVEVPIVSNSQCQQMFLAAGHVKAIRDTFICAGYINGGQDSCEGDSGGPLMVQRKDHRWVLVGTVSHGIGCADPNLPGVYMRTSAYRPWLDSIIYT